jgi:soluble lytic murein transglycosylase-like protein
MFKFISLAVAVLSIVAPSTPEHKDTYVSEEIQGYVNEVAQLYDLNPNLILAMIEAESSGRTKVVSKAGCVGLMQINPKWHKDRMDRLGVIDLTDAYGNILVGCDYVAEMFAKYDDVYCVLMGYNQGEYSGAIGKAMEGKYSKYAKKIVKRMNELETVRGD